MFFVTGTDTDCGKTTITRALAAAFTEAGYTVGVQKPVETGCLETDGDLVGEDAEALRRAARAEDTSRDEITPYRFALPASPERAAEAEGRGRRVEAGPILEALTRIEAKSDVVFVEGAGGLLVPLSPDLLIADLARTIGYPTIIVARNALGTVNHTMMTLEAARARGLEVVGVILSNTESEPPDLGNAEAIASHGLVHILGIFPYVESSSDQQLAGLAREYLDLESLEKGLAARRKISSRREKNT